LCGFSPSFALREFKMTQSPTHRGTPGLWSARRGAGRDRGKIPTGRVTQSRPPPGPRSPTCRWVSPRSPPGEIASWRTVQLAEACKHLLRSRGTVATRHPDEHSQKPRATSRLPNTSRTRSSHRLETLADLLCSPLTYSPARTLKRSQTNAFARRLATPVGCRALPVPEGWMRTRPA
jgi:hypothetical protein